MAAIYHPGVVTIVPHYNVGSGRDAVNVTHWKTEAVGLTVAQLNIIKTAFNSAWSAQWVTWASNTTSYLGCWVIDSASATGNQVDNSGYTPLLGNQGGGPCGDQVAGLLSLKGQTRYRGGHARLYIPGADLTKVIDGRSVSTSGMGILEAMWDNTVNALVAISGTGGGPYNPIIWHKKWSAAPNTIEDIVSRKAGSVIASQRRRVRKVSRHRKPTVVPGP